MLAIYARQTSREFKIHFWNTKLKQYIACKKFRVKLVSIIEVNLRRYRD